eukprot:COSAG06_NODE_47883_length_336_cov_0.658228_1_plen_25_part_01
MAFVTAAVAFVPLAAAAAATAEGLL